ncbi:MAG: serine hydrolase domain-containing protein [Anaerolineales bacterium]
MNHTSILKGIKNPQFKRLCEFAVAEMKRMKIPGSVVGVYYKGEEFIAGFGKTSIEHPLPVTPETLFQIGSNTKPMVATAVMHLVERGALDLDTPIVKYLPKFTLKDKDAAKHVTMRHLLTHTAGWEGDYFNDFGWGDDALSKLVASMTRLNQMTPLGEIWSYNNAAFYVAGLVLEKLTGKSFEAAMQALVFDPLGMDMSCFFPDDRIMTARYVVGHDLVEKRNRVSRPWSMSRAEGPAGGVLAPARDLLTFARFHMGDGTMNSKRVLKAASIRQMQQPILPATGLWQMGLSWFLCEVDGMKIVQHGGATNGQHSGFWFIPQKGFALTWLTNSSQARTDVLLDKALQIYFDVSIPKPTALDLPPATWDAFTGQYENIENILTLSRKKNEAWLSFAHKGGFPAPDSPPMPVPPPLRIAFYDQDKVIVLDEPLKDQRGEFLRASDGSLAWFRFGSRIHKKI